MQKSSTICIAIVVMAGVLLATTLAEAADTFHKLKDNEIRSKLAGMEITDGVHWIEQYMRDGSLKTFSMGKNPKKVWP